MTPYGSTSLANAYFQGRLHTQAWDRASEDQRFRALCEMTRRIDRLNYMGQKAVSTQEHQFPRQSEPLCENQLPVVDTAVPTAILEANYEGAYALLDGVDPEFEFQNLQVQSEAIQSVRTTYGRAANPDYVVAGIPSITAWQLLQPYLRASLEVKLSRVS